MNKIDQLTKAITTLSIQGATNVALSTLEGISQATKTMPKNEKSAARYLKKIGEKLAFSRPTEPLAQNAIRFIFTAMNAPIKFYRSQIADYRQLIAQSHKLVVKEAQRYIEDGKTYLVHCHSSSITAAFFQAHHEGKRFSVYVSETRPRFQGRITARELLDVGIPVTMMVDSAILSMLVQPSLEFDRFPIHAVFLGADLLSRKGFVNKVGSLAIAALAKQNNIPLYCLSTLLKYDPRQFSSSLIEKRNPQEIWNEAPKKMKILNPAFDFIPYQLEVKVITEEGLFNGSKIANRVKLKYPFITQ